MVEVKKILAHRIFENLGKSWKIFRGMQADDGEASREGAHSINELPILEASLEVCLARNAYPGSPILRIFLLP